MVVDLGSHWLPKESETDKAEKDKIKLYFQSFSELLENVPYYFLPTDVAFTDDIIYKNQMDDFDQTFLTNKAVQLKFLNAQNLIK